MTRFVRFIVFAVALTLGVPPSGGWSFELFGRDWRKTSKPMGEDFIICENGGPKGAATIIQKAAEAWNYPKFKFQFGGIKCLTNTSSNFNDGFNYISFDKIVNTVDAADALLLPSGSADADECDIRFDITRKWYIASGKPKKDEDDLFSVALHEFGHCLGLDHSKVPTAVMAPTLLKGDTRRELSPDDIAGRKKIYG